MRLIIILLCLCSSVLGQNLFIPGQTPARPYKMIGERNTIYVNSLSDVGLYSYGTVYQESYVWDSDFVRYASSLTVPLTNSTAIKINNLITEIKVGLGIDSLAQIADFWHIYANETFEAGLKNIVKRIHDATLVNAPTFTAFEGFAGNATNSYINTNYKVHSQGVNVTQDSATFMAYTRTTPRDTLKPLMTATRTTGDDSFIQLYPKYTGEFSISANSVVNIDTNNYTFDKGMYAIIRDTSRLKGYINSIKEIDRNSASTPPNDLNVYVGARNLNGTAGLFTNYQTSMDWGGTKLSASQYQIVLRAFEKYMDSNGKGVLSGAEMTDIVLDSSKVFDWGVDYAENETRFRIPVTTLTNNNVLIVSAEARRNGSTDYQMSDLVIKRSLDYGATWSAPQIVVPNNNVYTTVSHGSRVLNPGILNTDSLIYLFATKIDDATYDAYWGAILNPVNFQSDFGYKTSNDDGATWSDWVSLNALYAEDSVNLMAVGPGNGIILTNGTYVLPYCEYRYSTNTATTGTDWGIRAGVIYSADSGATWQKSLTIKQFTDESAIVEYIDNQIFMVSRSINKSYRVYTLANLSSSWAQHAMDKKIEAFPTQITLMKYAYAGKTKYLMSAPYDAGRADNRIRVSDDLTVWKNVVQTFDRAATGYTGITFNNDKLFYVLEVPYDILLYDFTQYRTKIME